MNVVLELDYAEGTALETVLADYVCMCKAELTKLQNDKGEGSENDPEYKDHRKTLMDITRVRGSHAKNFLRIIREKLDQAEQGE